MEHLIEYIRRQADVDHEAAVDCAYFIMGAVDEIIDEYFEEYFEED